MKTLTMNVLTAASMLAIGSSTTPASAWGHYENYTRVPLQGYLPYNSGYYNPYAYGGYPGVYNGYRGYGYGYDPYSSYKHARNRRVLKTTLIGAGIGAGAGALIGLSSRRGRVLRPALIGGGIGAGLGLGYGLLTHPRNYYW